MFSEMIQGLLNNGGQQAAEQRLAQINNYVNAYNLRPKQAENQGQVPSTSEIGDKVKSFQELLKAGALNGSNSDDGTNMLGTKFGSLLVNPESMSVQANIASKGIETSNEYAKASKSQILGMISKIAKKHGIDEKLVKAVIKQESGFNPKATSRCGAAGLMQLMPRTAKGFGVTDIYNPVQNVDAGCKFLKNLLKKYNGNVILALAAYNAGSGAVAKYNGVPPYRETQNYVKNILANYLG